MYTNDAVTKIREALNSVPYTQQTQNKLYLSILVEVEVIASSVLHENKCFKWEFALQKQVFIPMNVPYRAVSFVLLRFQCMLFSFFSPDFHCS